MIASPTNDDALIVVRRTDVLEFTRDETRTLFTLPTAEGETCGEGLFIVDAMVTPGGEVVVGVTDETLTERDCGASYVLYWDGEELRWI